MNDINPFEGKTELVSNDEYKLKQLTIDKQEPLFYNEELDVILPLIAFNILMPEQFGWVEIGESR
jgi:hypothetical protein